MAVFFNEKDNNRALSQADLLQLQGVSPFFKDEDGREVVQIDCMLFLVSELSLFGFTGNKWPSGKVYYSFDSNVTEQNQNRFLAACKEWSDVADIEFIERTNQTNYIHVKSDSGNSSFVGMIGGKQLLKIYNWNRKFIIAHEIGHALGLSHEQARGDRDTFVKINSGNIIPGKEHNFNKRTTTNYSTYDFASIMHYGQYAFSRNNLPTIEAQPDYEEHEDDMGNRSYMTSRDAAGMSSRYGAP